MSSFKKLYSFLNNKEKNKIKLFVFFLLIATFLEIVSISIIYPSISFIIESGEPDKLGFISSYFPFIELLSTIELLIFFLILFALINIAKSAYLIFFSWWQNDFLYSLDKNINYNLLDFYISSSLTFFNENSSATLSKNIITETKKIKSSIGASLKLVTEILVIISISIVLIYFQPIASLITIGFFTFFGLILNYSLRKKLFKLGFIQVQQLGKVFQTIKDSFGSFKDIKIRENKNFFLKRFANHIDSTFKTIKYQLIISETVKIILELLGILFFCFLIYFLTKIETDIKNILPSLALFGAAAYKFLPSLNKIINYTQNLHNNRAAIDLLYKDLQNKNIKKDNKLLKFDFKKTIEFKNVSFKYSNSKKNVINKLNFKIKKNDFICILGDSGKGKTTLIDLLSGLYRPNKGKILVDRMDINKNTRLWRKNIGYVPQKIYLINDTIINNIILKDKAKPESKKLKYALDSSQLSSLIQSKKNGLNFKVGDNGSRLSGGQIQRIGIARSLYTLPKLLICDEVSSSLDKETEKNLIKSLAKLKGKLTIIFITHRPEIFNNTLVKNKYQLVEKKNNITTLKKTV